MKFCKLLVTAAICLPIFTATASEDGHESKTNEDAHEKTESSERELNSMEDLKAEVRALREAVRSLQMTQPNITELMPDFAERFHVMHYAGEAEDWAVASHEYLQLQRIMRVIKEVDLDNGRLMEGFLKESFNEINSAIEHGDVQAFNKVLVKTVDNCNACHAAAGAEFIEITLDPLERLSMRHPHKLQSTEKPGDHTHTH